MKRVGRAKWCSPIVSFSPSPNVFAVARQAVKVAKNRKIRTRKHQPAHVGMDTDQDFTSKFFTTCVLCFIMFVTAVPSLCFIFTEGKWPKNKSIMVY